MILDAPSKLVYHYDKLYELFKTGKTYPVHITVGLTNYCNHKCIWCYIDFAKDKSNKINADIDKLLIALKSAKNFGAKAITLVGDGEPTLHPEFGRFLEKVYNLGYDIGLFTNGGWKNETITESILNFCTFVRFSVDSASEEIHKKTHRSNDFNLVINNIKKIVKKKREDLIVGVQFAFNHINYTEIEKAAEFYKKINIDYLSYKPVYKNELNKQHPDNLVNSIEIKNFLKKAKNFEDEKFHVYWKDWQLDTLIFNKENSNRGYNKCRAIWLSPYIDENGDVEFCGNLKGRGFTIGNIYEDNFENIWMSKKHFEKISKIDLNKCPKGCKLHALNLKLEDIANPDKNKHVNFI